MLIELPSIEPDEALNGYLLRLAQRNGLGGIQQLLEPLAIKPRASYSPEQVGRVAHLLGVDRNRLAQANLVDSRTTRPEVNAQFAAASRLPVCPLCFADEPIVRVQWLNVMTPVCPRHGVRLVDRCGACGSPLTWRRLALSYCDCGNSLEDAAAAPAPTFSLAFTRAVYGFESNADDGLLPPKAFVGDGCIQADHLAWFLARYQADPGGTRVLKRPKPASTDEAIELLEFGLAPVFAEWPRGLERLLESIDASSPNHSAGIGKQLGNWYRILHRHFGPHRFGWLHEAVAQYVAAHLVLTINDRVTRIPKALRSISGWLAVTEAARMIGVAPERLRIALHNGDVEGRTRNGGSARDLGFLRRDVVERLRQCRSEYVEGRSAMALLQVSKRQLRRLVDAGGLIHHDAADRPVLVDAPYRVDEIQRLLSDIESRYRPWTSSRHGAAVDLDDIVAVRGRGEDYVLRAYRAIARGDVVPRDLCQDAVGMRRFVFDEEELNAIALPSPQDFRMTMTQLCDMTGWKHESVAKWIANGFLKAERFSNGATMTTVLRVDDLIHFLSRHVILSVLAKECGSQSSHLADLIESQGGEVHSFYGQTQRGKFGSILPLESLGALLQELCRPEKFHV